MPFWALGFESIRSERQPLMLAAERLSVRRYLGYSLDEPLPDAATLTRLRQRLCLPFFRRFFEHIVDLCIDAGLVWGQELIADATRERWLAATGWGRRWGPARSLAVAAEHQLGVGLAVPVLI